MRNFEKGRIIKVDGLNIFYREAGESNSKTILMLHGFPSSSHMYRNLISDLGQDYHVIAPDYPGFGLSDIPLMDEFEYTFDNLAQLIEKFVKELGLKDIYLLMQDYGGPIGMRIATANPDLIQGLIIQNANAYLEGLGEWPQKMAKHIENNEIEQLTAFKNHLLSSEGIKEQYLTGASDKSKISPEAYLTDAAFFDREGVRDIQSALFANYGSNFPKYPNWQAYLKQKQPRTLVIWGENDKFFGKAGAEAYKKDLKDVEVHLFNAGHFMLEEFPKEAIGLIREFVEKQ